jgi:hypothetical protein
MQSTVAREHIEGLIREHLLFLEQAPREKAGPRLVERDGLAIAGEEIG